MNSIHGRRIDRTLNNLSEVHKHTILKKNIRIFQNK